MFHSRLLRRKALLDFKTPTNNLDILLRNFGRFLCLDSYQWVCGRLHDKNLNDLMCSLSAAMNAIAYEQRCVFHNTLWTGQDSSLIGNHSAGPISQAALDSN